MPIDTSIYSQIRPFQMEDATARDARYYQVEEQRRRFQLEDDLSGALAASGGDLNKASAMLAQRGRGAASLQLRDKAEAQKKADLDQRLKLAEAMSSDAIAVDSFYRDALQKAGGNREAAIAATQPVWDGLRETWASRGQTLPEAFNPEKNFAGIGQAKELAAHLKNLQPEYGSPVTAVGANGKPELYQPDKRGGGRFMGVEPGKVMEPTELARLQAERDALPEGDPRRAQYDRVLANYKAGRGDTAVTVNTGPMTPGKTAAGKIDEDLLGTTRSLMQLDTIARQFKPEFQRFSDKLGFAALKAKDSSPIGLTVKEKADLTAYSQYRRNSFQALNDYIKSVTGAAMSEAEAQRILKAMPNAGEGLFDGDSPTEFKAKLDDAISQTKMAVARLAYVKRNGMSLFDGAGNAVVALTRMPELIKERGSQLEAELTKPGSDKAAVKKAVLRQLGIEFGLATD